MLLRNLLPNERPIYPYKPHTLGITTEREVPIHVIITQNLFFD
jgi:hypothetical protein